MSDTWTWDDQRAAFDRLAERVEDWQGIPVPIPEQPLQLHDRHPLRRYFREIDGVEVPVIVGGPACDYEDEVIVNSWRSRRHDATVYVYRKIPSGRAFAVKLPNAPGGSMERLTLWVTTIGASDAWDLDAEHRAREKLRGLLSERQWRHYDLTGAFFETSAPSRLTYLFRRLRPTVVLTPRSRRDPAGTSPEAALRCLAVLCMHGIGFYSRSWAGCLTPSDDVISHLLWMRGDEAGFWKVANQHEAWWPEAGL